MSDLFCLVFEVIDISKLVVGFEGMLMILCGVSLLVYVGESFVIVGVFGFGKIILFGLLVGLDLFSSGSIYVDGQMLEIMDEEVCVDLCCWLVGFVFQLFYLLLVFIVEENVMLLLELEGVCDVCVCVCEVLDVVGLGSCC